MFRLEIRTTWYRWFLVDCNQTQRPYNGLGQLISEYQSHSGAANINSTPKVRYASSEMSGWANHGRLTSMTYPDGFVVNYNYSSGLNDTISRLSSLSDTSGTLESYSYLGLGTVVIRGHSQPGVDLTYVKQSGESTGDAGDQYTGLDRFGRVVDQRWIKTSSGTATDRFQYGYDRDGNRVWRDNLVNSAFGELYSYDNLNQITSFDRGTLNANKNGISGSPTRQQAWDFDALGNFDSVTTDSSTQTRSHNDQNEITSISGATTPTYDANGNMTGDETGRKFVYDAWNRLVTVKDSSNNVLESFAYDGANRRVSTTASSTTTDLYYSSGWQVLEERVGGNTTMQYVWSPVYIDAMILRDRDTDSNGSLDERLWVQQDANFNVTAILNGSGSVVERYAYDPFGSATFYDASWGSQSSSGYAWVYLHQGGRYDPIIDLYDFRRREYSSSLSRWIQIDPSSFGAGDTLLYRYVRNCPVLWTDWQGLAITSVDAAFENCMKLPTPAARYECLKNLISLLKETGVWNILSMQTRGEILQAMRRAQQTPELLAQAREIAQRINRLKQMADEARKCGAMAKVHEIWDEIDRLQRILQEMFK